MFAAVQVQAQVELQVFVSLLRVFAMAWESDAQEIDLWAAVRTVLLADDLELGSMFDRVPLRDLVRYEGSLASEDPPSPHCAASAALNAPMETASSSSGPGPFFANESTQSAAAQQVLARAAAPQDQFAIPKAQDAPYELVTNSKPVVAPEVKSVPAKPSSMAPPASVVVKPAPVKATPAQVALYFEERVVVAEVPKFPPPKDGRGYGRRYGRAPH